MRTPVLVTSFQLRVHNKYMYVKKREKFTCHYLKVKRVIIPFRWNCALAVLSNSLKKGASRNWFPRRDYGETN